MEFQRIKRISTYTLKEDLAIGGARISWASSAENAELNLKQVLDYWAQSKYIEIFEDDIDKSALYDGRKQGLMLRWYDYIGHCELSRRSDKSRQFGLFFMNEARDGHRYVAKFNGEFRYHHEDDETKYRLIAMATLTKHELSGL